MLVHLQPLAWMEASIHDLLRCKLSIFWEVEIMPPSEIPKMTIINLKSLEIAG
jgi:hypothetical protein